jgi:hypothetical protein
MIKMKTKKILITNEFHILKIQINGLKGGHSGKKIFNIKESKYIKKEEIQ